MGLAQILEIINGVLKFPDACLALVRVLQKTPAEKQQELITSIQKEADNYAKTGRPTWQ